MANQTFTCEFNGKRGGFYKAVISYNDPTAAAAQNTDVRVVSASIERNEVDTDNAIISSSFELTIKSPGDRTFVPLARLDYTLVSCTLYKKVNNTWTLYWFGYLDPAGYSEPYERFLNYDASFTFTDFGLFKNISVERAQALLNNPWADAAISGGAYPMDFFLYALRPNTASLSSIDIDYPSAPVYGSVTDYQGTQHNLTLFESKSVRTGSGALDLSVFQTHIPYQSIERTNGLYDELEKILYSAKVYLYQDTAGRLCLKSFEEITTENPGLIKWTTTSQTLELADNYGELTVDFEPKESESKDSLPLVSADAIEAFPINESSLNTAGIVFTNSQSMQVAPKNDLEHCMERNYKQSYKIETANENPIYGHTAYSRQYFDAIEKDFRVPSGFNVDAYGHGGVRALSPEFTLLTCPPSLSPAVADALGQPGVQPRSGVTCFHSIKQKGEIDELDGFICQWVKDKTPYEYKKSKNELSCVLNGSKLTTNSTFARVLAGQPENPVYKTDLLSSPYISEIDSSKNYELLIESKLLCDFRPTPAQDAPDGRLFLLSQPGAKRFKFDEFLTTYRNKISLIAQPITITCSSSLGNYYYQNIMDSSINGVNPVASVTGFDKISVANLPYMMSGGYWVRQTSAYTPARTNTYLCYYNDRSMSENGVPFGDGFVRNWQSIPTTVKKLDPSISANPGEHVILPYFNSISDTNCYVYDSNGNLSPDPQSVGIGSSQMTFQGTIYSDMFRLLCEGDWASVVVEVAQKDADLLISSPTLTIQKAYTYSVVDQTLSKSSRMDVKIIDDESNLGDKLELTISYAVGAVNGNYLALESTHEYGAVLNGIEKFLHTQSGTTYTFKGLEYFTAMTLSQFRRDAIKLSGTCLPTEPLAVVADSACPGKKFYKTRSTIDLVSETDEATFTEITPVDYVPA